jgi:hypothetical protein
MLFLLSDSLQATTEQLAQETNPFIFAHRCLLSTMPEIGYNITTNDYIIIYDIISNIGNNVKEATNAEHKS